MVASVAEQATETPKDTFLMTRLTCIACIDESGFEVTNAFSNQV